MLRKTGKITTVKSMTKRLTKISLNSFQNTINPKMKNVTIAKKRPLAKVMKK
jgi:hypothetical protein